MSTFNIQKTPISLGVVSLYTNIEIEESISTTLQYIQTQNPDLKELILSVINNALHLFVPNETFDYPGYDFFKHNRGLALGRRLSGTVAILTMD